MSSLRVTEANGDGTEWNSFVEADPEGSTFHRWEWRDVYRTCYGHDTPYLSAHRDTQLVGVLPLVRVRSLVFGHYLVSLPFVSYGGPIGDAEAKHALAQHAVKIANGAKLVELRSRAAFETDLTLSSRKITVLCDLVPGDYDATFKGFDSKVRSQVRRAEREGLVVRFGPEMLQPFHDVLSEHMRDLGSPSHGKSFFEQLANALGTRAWIGVAFLGDTPIAAGFAIENGAEVEISWASSLRRHSKIAPNMALYGAFIRRACEANFRVFNFGRCTPGTGTHKFKQQWGTRDEPLAWYQYSASGEVAPPTPDSGVFALATRVWQKLPLAITVPLGSHLIGGIP